MTILTEVREISVNKTYAFVLPALENNTHLLTDLRSEVELRHDDLEMVEHQPTGAQKSNSTSSPFLDHHQPHALSWTSPPGAYMNQLRNMGMCVVLNVEQGQSLTTAIIGCYWRQGVYLDLIFTQYFSYK